MDRATSLIIIIFTIIIINIIIEHLLFDKEWDASVWHIRLMTLDTQSSHGE